MDDGSFNYSNWVDRFCVDHFPVIEGWVDQNLFGILKIIKEIQDKLAVQGGVLEIGVHHGRFFIPLNAMVGSSEGMSFAIDIFDNQSINIDFSGKGSLSEFKNNLAMYDRHAGGNVKCIESDSTRLIYNDILDIKRSPPKIISIDGGHTVEHTISDINFATQVICENGIIIVDDILNSHWIGVIEGVVTFLQRRPTVWPFFVGYNKLMLAPMSYHQHYLSEFKARLPDSKNVTMCGYSLLAA